MGRGAKRRDTTGPATNVLTMTGRAGAAPVTDTATPGPVDPLPDRAPKGNSATRKAQRSGKGRGAVVVPFAPPASAPAPAATPPDLVDPARSPPDVRLLDLYSAADSLRDEVLPWRRVQGRTIVLADALPDERCLARLGAAFGPVRLARCATGAAGRSLREIAGPALAQAAERRCPAGQSCRGWDTARTRRRLWRVLGVLALATALAPLAMLTLLLAWSCVTLVCTTGLKLAAALIDLRRPRTPVALPIPVVPPVISLLVPLYEERAVAGQLLTRLAALDYPRDRLEVLLILEDDDACLWAVTVAAAHMLSMLAAGSTAE